MNNCENVMIENLDDWKIEYCRFNFYSGRKVLEVEEKDSKKSIFQKNIRIKSNCNLQNLFSDLVSGNVKKEEYINPPLFVCDLSDEMLIILFFPELENKKINSKSQQGVKLDLWKGDHHSVYKTNFLKCDSNNTFFSSLFWDQQENGRRGQMYPIEEIVENMEKRCAYFINKYKHQSDRLNRFLCTYVDAFIDEIEELNKKYKEDKTGVLNKKNNLKEYFDTIKNNNVKLLARIIILAAFRFEDMSPTILYEIIMGKNNLEYEMEAECDKQYIRSLFSQNTNEQFELLKQAYRTITKNAKFAKQIMLAYGKNAISIGKYSEAFNAFSDLKSKFTDCGDAYRYLAYCYENGYGCEKSAELALKNYTLAAELEDSESLIWLSNKILASDSVDKDKAKKYCQIVLKNEVASRSSWYGKAAFILAKLSDDKDEIIKYYKLSAESGYAPAVSKVRTLEKKKRIIDDSRNEINSTKEKDKYFLTNCASINNNIFKGVNFEDYFVYSLKNESSLSYISIPDFLKKNYTNIDSIEQFPKRSIFAFCSEDETQNINDVLLLLDYLYNESIDMDLNTPEDGGRRKAAFVESIDIFVSANYNTATMLIDASLADMGTDVYFKTHVFDIEKTTARWLLSSHPLFMPAISSNEKKVHLITFGNTPFVYNLIKESVSCCYMTTCDLKITAVDNEVSNIERIFKQEASGLYVAPLKRKLLPEFMSLDLYSVDLENSLSARADSDAVGKLLEGNYFVVDIGSDFENIRLAKRLRTYLLRNDEAFKKFPFIAVRVSDPRNAYLAERLTVGNKAPNSKSWFNNYGFCVFSDCFPSFDEKNLSEKLGLNVHLSYYGDDIEAGRQAYYTYSYNRDSSEAAAVGLIYKMFDCSVFFENPADYSSMTFDMLKDLATKYHETIKKDPNMLKQAASSEQTRFNCYLLANGWHYARPEQVLAYMTETKSVSHKQELAKLHPFMFDFEDFSEDGFSKFVILKNHLGDSNLKNPIDSTIRAVKNVLEYFKENGAQKGIDSIKEER